ncbi:MAG: alpha/beta hydrolase [Chthonomonas sp.]|nr:alpha/beta hydrolase [Chthonomonas sp.]
MIATTALLLTVQFSKAPEPTDLLPRKGALGVAFSPVPADLATKLNLKPGTGLLAQKPVPGLTAAAAGVTPGDVITSLNGQAITPQNVGVVIRGLSSGKELKISVLRDGKPQVLVAVLAEKPRDPGNDNFSVEYSHVVSNGKRMRTIITTPKKPGRHPGFMFIQGLSPVSYDFKLEGPADLSRIDAPLLYEMANSGYVTIRVDKPGVGDSEGGPYETVDYITELDIYRQTMKQLTARKDVDTSNLFIFGHSMGGSFGPMIATETPLKGIAVYGTAGRTWREYLNDTLRYQGQLAGDTFSNLDETVRLVGRIMDMAFYDKMSVAEIKKKHPELANLVDAYMPGGLFNGKNAEFWGQLGTINFAAYWEKVNTRVLAVKGESDFVVYEADHKLIADIVNRANPGWGRFEIAESSDHLFNKWPSEKESLANWPKGEFNMEFTNMMKAWMADLISKK